MYKKYSHVRSTDALSIICYIEIKLKSVFHIFRKKIWSVDIIEKSSGQKKLNTSRINMKYTNISISLYIKATKSS